jgi:hypothetical protein
MTADTSIIIVHNGELFTIEPSETASRAQILSVLRNRKSFAEQHDSLRALQKQVQNTEAAERAAEMTDDEAALAGQVFAYFDLETLDEEGDGFITIRLVDGSVVAPQPKPAAEAQVSWFDALHAPARSEEFTSVSDLPGYASGGFVSSSRPSRRPIPTAPALDPKRPIPVGSHVVISADALLRLISRNGYTGTAERLGVQRHEVARAYRQIQDPTA